MSKITRADVLATYDKTVREFDGYHSSPWSEFVMNDPLHDLMHPLNQFDTSDPLLVDFVSAYNAPVVAGDGMDWEDNLYEAFERMKEGNDG